jgi:hypothetical protein
MPFGQRVGMVGELQNVEGESLYTPVVAPFVEDLASVFCNSPTVIYKGRHDFCNSPTEASKSPTKTCNSPTKFCNSPTRPRVYQSALSSVWQGVQAVIHIGQILNIKPFESYKT